MKEWDSFGLDPMILRGIYANGFEFPSPIQEKAIPILLKGGDVIAQAQSGTGKTGAFCISALQLCDASKGQQILILSPTRELASQTYEVFQKLATFTEIRSQLLIGGTSVDQDIQDMRKQPHVIIGCPGRVVDFLSRRVLSSDISIIILDEAKEKVVMSIKEKLKRAFSIIIGAYFASVVALIPLLWAGAGLLKGFAITTIIGISVGILITRPAFTDMVRFLEKE
jgi:superfamily II DNA/RNA helicase